MIQVLQAMKTRKHSAWRKTVGMGWWGMIKSGRLELTRRVGSWRALGVRSHAERRRKPGERWAAVEVGNGIADRAADHPEGRLQTGLVPNPTTPVKWWTAISGRPPEEVTDTLDRIVNRMSKKSDTAGYIWKRQGVSRLIVDWREHVRWDWRVFQGWKELQMPPRVQRRLRQGQEVPVTAAEDLMFRVTSQRPVGGLTIFTSKLWWGLLPDEHKRKRDRTKVPGKNGGGRLDRRRGSRPTGKPDAVWRVRHQGGYGVVRKI
jgi:hypothetical protein